MPPKWSLLSSTDEDMNKLMQQCGEYRPSQLKVLSELTVMQSPFHRKKSLALLNNLLELGRNVIKEAAAAGDIQQEGYQ